MGCWQLCWQGSGRIRAVGDSLERCNGKFLRPLRELPPRGRVEPGNSSFVGNPGEVRSIEAIGLMTQSLLARSPVIMLLVLCSFATGSACNKKPKEMTPAGEASAVASGAVVIPAKGDTGVVEGTVTMEGDPAAIQSDLAARVPTDCAEALKMYNLVFREGPGRRVADVFVGVTGYPGTPGEKRGPVTVSARGCAWDRRTYGLTVEQHLAIQSADHRPYVPKLFGANSGASLVAVPRGEAIPVYPKGPGMYVLVDQMRNFVQSTVLVVKFPTFDVTGLDGKFRIADVPIGKSKISAYLPTVDLNVEQTVTVAKRSTTRVDLKLRFDAAAYAAQAAAAAASASASPTSTPSP